MPADFQQAKRTGTAYQLPSRIEISGTNMQFGMLGSFNVICDGRQLDLGGRKQRVLLAMLACHANQMRSVQHLVDELWDGRPPPTALENLRVYVYQLRRILGKDRIRAGQSSSYELIVDHDELDIETFTNLLTQGQRALAGKRPHQASEHLRAALDVWRGPALADLRDVESLRAMAVWLDERWLAAVESKNAAELELGMHAQIVGDLALLADQHPLRENIRAQLMLALYRSGRRAEALAAFRQGREFLVAELGVEPGPDLRRLHQAILADDELVTKCLHGASPAAAQLSASESPLDEIQQIKGLLGQITCRLDRLESGLRQ